MSVKVSLHGNILFGGSFDPIHLGHIHLIQQILRIYSPTRLFLVPAAQNPLKGSAAAKAEDRLKMAQLGVEELEDPRIEVLDWEVRRKAPSFTLDTVTRLLEQDKAPLAVVLGNEVFASLARWHEPKKLLSMVDLIVVVRDEKVSIEPEKVLKQVGILDVTQEKGRWEHSNKKHWIEPCVISALSISSTAIRETLSQLSVSTGTPGLPQGIQRSVWQYIKENRIYAVSK